MYEQLRAEAMKRRRTGTESSLEAPTLEEFLLLAHSVLYFSSSYFWPQTFIQSNKQQVLEVLSYSLATEHPDQHREPLVRGTLVSFLEEETCCSLTRDSN